MKRLIIALGVLCLFIPARGHSACLNPPGVAGEIVYNEAFCVTQQCDGTYWRSMGPGVLPCNPTTPQWLVAEGVVATIGVADTLSVYVTANDDSGSVTYSKQAGDAWISINPTTGQLTGTPPGLGTYTITARASDPDPNSADRTFTVQVNATAPPGGCPNIGDICPDGSIFAGISPDGNKYMYVERCDATSTWNGSACTSGTPTFSWNNGNNPGFTYIAVTSAVAGSANTAALDGVDADSATTGVQPHRAAQACANSTVHGHTDWYLPATNELLVIYENLVDATPNDNVFSPIVSGFVASTYWSSTEHSGGVSASAMDFTNGTVRPDWQTTKTNLFRVRCARTD